MSSPTMQPVAQGSLASTPFAHLVLYVYQRRSSGTLVVQLTAAEVEALAGADPLVRVLFHRGRAVAAHVPHQADALDQALLPLCSVEQGSYEFFEDDLVGSGPTIVTGMFDPYAFVAESARRGARPDAVEEVLARVGDTPLCVQPGMDLERLSLSPSEMRFADVLREGTATVAALCGRGELAEDAARRLVYALLVTKVIGPFAPANCEVQSMPAQGAEPSGTPRAAPAQASSSAERAALTAEERRRQSSAAWSAIARRASQVSRPLSAPPSRGPVERELPTTAPGRAIASASPANTNRSLTPASTSGVTPAAGRGQEPVPPPGSAAPRVTTPSRPISRVTSRPSSEPLELLDNEGKFRRVEQLCQRGAFDEALPIIRALVEQDRNSAAYLGMLANVLFGQCSSAATIPKELIETVNQALRLNPDEVRSLYTKARCYKRMGKLREALHYFRRTVAVDPAHLDAAREARLLLLRHKR